MKHAITIHRKKKFNVFFDGQPSSDVQVVDATGMIGVCPQHFRLIKPKVVVKVGDMVKQGQPLFFDKKNPQVYVHSPLSGEVKTIEYGHQRRLEKIEIMPDATIDPLQFQPVDIESLTIAKAKSMLLERGLWHGFSEHPFRTIPNPAETPPAIVVMLSNPEPFHPKISAVIDQVDHDLVTGIQVLKRLTEHVVVVVDANEKINCDEISSMAKVVRMSGDFSLFEPASALYHLKDKVEENKSWSCDWHTLVNIARTVKSQQFFPQQFISVGGNQANDNRHYCVTKGIQINQVVTKEDPTNRIIFGGLFTGLHCEHVPYLPLGVSAINIVDSHPQPEFLSFLQPGLKKPSFTTAYLSGLLKAVNPTPTSTALNGSERDCISCGLCHDVCPVDMLPQTVLRNVAGNDIEGAMAFGLLDCSNCSVCTYVCPSKIDLSARFQEAKDALYLEVTAA